MKRLSLIMLIALLAGVIFGCAPAATQSTTEAPQATEVPQATEASVATQAPAEPTAATTSYRVAIIFPGSIKDAGWNQSGYEAAMAAKEKYGVEVSFQESVATADVKDVLRNYAADGYDLVIGHDYNFTDPIIEIAPEFPNTLFGISGGYMVEGSNVVAVSGTNWEATYLAGVLAGLMTKTNKIGLLTVSESPTSNMMINGFESGARRNNPDAQVVYAFTGSWDDVVKGKELVRSMIDQGADIIYTQSGQVNVGAVEAAAEAGVYAIGGAVDMWETAPDTVISSALASPGYYVDNLIKMLVAGTLKEKGGQIIVLGVKDGVEDLAPYHNFEDKIPQDVKDKVAEARQDIIDGKIPTPSDVRGQ